MTRPRKAQVDGSKNTSVIDIEKAFKQVAGRMQQIRREHGSAKAYQEEFRSRHHIGEADQKLKKGRR
jgi:hypothetical protein